MSRPKEAKTPSQLQLRSAKFNPSKWPKLREAWDAYGHEKKFDELYDARTDGRSCYIVVCWRTQEGKLALADLARTGTSADWEMQNDGMSPDITDAEWSKLRIEPDCDNFFIPGHADYTPWGDQS